MPKLYLHMGFHKTATTSFQVTCKNNLRNLEEQGYLYPLFSNEYIKSKIHNHSTPVFSIFSESPSNYHMNIRHKVQNIEKLNSVYLDQLTQALSSRKNLILSGEDISMLPEKSLGNLSKLLNNYNFEIIPIVLVRAPYEFHCSAFQEIVKTGIHLTNCEFYSRIRSIKNIKKVFPNTLFVPFKHACQHKSGPVGYLLEVMGLSYDNFTIDRANDGMCNTALRLQNTLNNLEPSIKSGKLNDKYTSLIIYSTTFPSKFLLTDDEYQIIKEDCDKENDFFKEVLGEEFMDTSIKFSDKDEPLKDIATFLSEIISENKYVNTLNQASQKLKENNLQLAIALLELSIKLNPQDNKVKKLLQTYKEELNKKSTLPQRHPPVKKDISKVENNSHNNSPKATNEIQKHANLSTPLAITPSLIETFKNIIFQPIIKKNAFAHCNLGNLELAESVVQNVIANNPTTAWAYYILGKVHWQRGEKVQAHLTLQKAIDLEPHTQYFKTFKEACKKKIKLIATLLVRDEIDIVEENIRFHLSMGVDFIVATDNGSIDGTRDILLKYQKLGLLELIDEPEHNYAQEKWVNTMVKIARDKYHADWVINLDADEFYYSKQGNLKDDLQLLDGYNIIFLSRINMFPPTPSKTLPPFYSFTKAKSIQGKCIVKAKDYIYIKMGSHNADMYNKKSTSYDGIIIHHYFIRSYKQFEHNTITSGEALLKLENRGTRGNHMINRYNLYLSNKLEEEYTNLISDSKDATTSNYIKDYFNKSLTQKKL